MSGPEPPYHSVLSAKAALDIACRDTEAEYGRDTMEQAYYDLLHNVLLDCAPHVAVELARREGVDPPR